jgi:hypothetical protein
MTEPACWKCATVLRDLALPFGRRAECPACHAELHVCRMCRHFDTGKAKQCREPMAEEVKDKTRANFCEWFQTGEAASPAGPARCGTGGRAALDALFDAPADAPATDDPRKALDDLFGD